MHRLGRGEESSEREAHHVTMLEVNSISGVQEAQYQHYLRCFKDFCKESKIGFPKDNKLDAVLADYFDVLFLDGKAAAEGEKTLASLEFFNHKMKGKLTRSRKALKGWRRRRPPKSRLPLPKPAVWGIASLLAPRRDSRSEGEEFSEAGWERWSAIQTLHSGDQGRGRPDSRQDRSLQQFNETGQSPDCQLVGTSASADGAKKEAGRSIVQLRAGQVPETVSRGRLLAWLAKSALVPAEAQRGFRRSLPANPRPQCSERQGKMVDRRLSSEVRQKWQGSGDVEQDASLGPCRQDGAVVGWHIGPLSV